MHIYPFVAYLQFQTFCSSLDAGLDTLFSRVGGRTAIPLYVLLKVCIYLDDLNVHFIDINEGHRPLQGLFNVFFNTMHRRGKNYNICDYVQMRHAITPPFWILSYVSILDGIASYVYCPVYFSCFGRYQRVSISLLLPLVVCSFLSSETFLTCLMRRL